MHHPYFDALSYPWSRPEAGEFHGVLTQLYDSAGQIDLLYHQCGEDLPKLYLGQSAELIWREALDNLTKHSGLRRLLEIVETEFPKQAKVAELIQRIRHGDRDTGGKQPSALALAAQTLPPMHLPYRSLGPLFIGREGMMERLRASLQGSTGTGDSGTAQVTAIVNAVHGLGGVGKTRLAVEYGWRHAQEHSAVLLISAESPELLQTNLATLCGVKALDLPEQEATEQAVQVKAALRWLRAHPGWLLILDNVDTPEAAAAVEDLVNGLHGGQVLITSRLETWSAGITPLELEVLALEDAVKFLEERTKDRRRHLPATDAEDAAALAKELGGLALALEQAGAYISQTQCSLSEYLARWREHDRKVQEWFDKRTMNYPRSVATTWETSLQQLGPAEVSLLRLLSFLAPEPIPEFLLEGEKSEKVLELASELAQAEGITGPETPPSAPVPPLAQLAKYSMLKRSVDEQTLTVHRVVQEILRTRIPQEAYETWLTAGMGLVHAAVSWGQSFDVRTWPVWTPMSAHVGAAATHGEAAGIYQPTTSLMGELGSYLGTKAQHREAENWKRRALAIAERTMGKEAPEVTLHLNNLAQTLQAIASTEEAELLMRRALTINEKCFGPNHPKIAIALGNLASLLQARDRFSEAEPLMRRALSINELCLGSNHSNTAIDLNNLAALLFSTSRHAEAEPLMRRALAIDEQNFGSDHPSIARDLNNLAQLLLATNRHCDVEPLMRRALAIEEESFGPNHPEVAETLNNLAQFLQTTNRLTEAKSLMRRALAIDEEFFGPNHPNVALRQANLASLLQASNDFVEAEELMKSGIAILEVSSGKTHSNVATAIHNLAVLLHATHRYSEAEPLIRRAIAIYELNFGQNHPNIAAALNSLASLLRATKRLSEAEPLSRRMLEILARFQRDTGHQHPHSQTALGNYARILSEMGLDEAAVMQKITEVIQGAVGSPESPKEE